MARGGRDAVPARARIDEALTGAESVRPWDPRHRASYALADALLSVETDVSEFHERFAKNYAGCAARAPNRDPDIVLQVRTLPGVVLANWVGSVGDPVVDFPAAFLPGPCHVAPAARSGWYLADLDHPVGCVAYGPDGMAAKLDSPWEALFASVAVNRALSTQPQIMFFHGAAVRVNGRGVLLLGVSGSGKTSVSLAIAARGHDFYGDDIVGVRLRSRALVPLLRAAHVRSGPAAPAVARALARADDSDLGRRLTNVAELFPQAGTADAALDIVVCLRSFTQKTELTAFSPGARDLKWVTPHVGSLYAGPAAERAMRVVSLFSTSACFFLDSASPESAADALEQLTE